MSTDKNWVPHTEHTKRLAVAVATGLPYSEISRNQIEAGVSLVSKSGMTLQNAITLERKATVEMGLKKQVIDGKEMLRGSVTATVQGSCLMDTKTFAELSTSDLK